MLNLFFILPIFNEIEKNSIDLISAKNSMVTFNAQIAETGYFKNNYASYKTNLDMIDQLFVDPADPVNFIKFLEDTASGYQITSQISLPPSSQNQNKTNQGFILFQLASKGSFSNVLSFVKMIETGPYLIEIENLTIQNSSDPSSGSSAPVGSLRKVEATFTIKSFTKK